ncbi:MAG: hypothetical protein AAF664_20040 [Planctomycetota bacterium]
MPRSKKLRIASQALIGMVGVVLVLAGTLKLINVGADDMLEGLRNARLIQHTNLISITAIICGVLLLVPLSRPFGVLMSTAYWGGAIVAHLTYDDSAIMPAFFLTVLWLGVFIGAYIPIRTKPKPSEGSLDV